MSSIFSSFSSSKPSDADQPPPSPFSEPTSSHDLKIKLMQMIRDQYAISNAKQLMDKINGSCFNNCITKPSSSLGSSETACVSACAEKYMTAFKVVGEQLLQNIQTKGGIRMSGLGA